ncbi:MAG: hypothetical protein R6U61_06890 [Thermoplasmata archaeon]
MPSVRVTSALYLLLIDCLIVVVTVIIYFTITATSHRFILHI